MPGAESAQEFVQNSPTENFIFCTFAAAIGGQAILSISDTVSDSQWGGTDLPAKANFLTKSMASKLAILDFVGGN